MLRRLVRCIMVSGAQIVSAAGIAGTAKVPSLFGLSNRSCAHNPDKILAEYIQFRPVRGWLAPTLRPAVRHA
jgi:hypothetical protein